MCIRDRHYSLEEWDNFLKKQSDSIYEYIAVSYTHLDVYKRQVVFSAHDGHPFNKKLLHVLWPYVPR